MRPFHLLRILTLGFCLALAPAQGAITEETIAGLNKALEDAKASSSDARKRLAVRRTIRDAEEVIESNKDKPERYLAIAFLFRAQQALIKMDKDPKHRDALIEICRELAKAPKEYAHLAFDADLLLTQVELAKKNASNDERAEALRPLVDRYVESSEGARVLRVAMTMALELGDVGLVADLREMIAQRYAADHQMIHFQRHKLGGQVLGVPMAGSFKRSDGRTARLPMDLLGRASMVVFWSKEDKGLDFVKGLAQAAKEAESEHKGRLSFVSINLDELPDAGESIIRGLGVDWPVLHLPGGREHPIYKAYTQEDPKMMNVTPTGQTALIMSGVGRVRVKEDGSPDFNRYFGSALARGWAQTDYAMHMCALMAGDFLVFDPEGPFNPAMPPELKVAGGDAKPKSLARGATSVPEETLQAIQACFVAPPMRYRLSYHEARANYAKAAGLCRKAIADHASAPDLWIVRNRLIVAQLGLWKTTGDLKAFEIAVTDAQSAMEAGYPKGCDIVARFCVSRAALREAGEKSGEVIDQFVADQGGESGEGANGPALAAASILALDVADRLRFERLRDVILKDHTESPAMWIYSSFLLERHHRYWMFQVPFTAGWSYGRREGYFKALGNPDAGARMLKGELQDASGKAFRIPEDLTADYTAIFINVPGPWSSKRDDGLPPSPMRTMQGFAGFAATRPDGNVQTILTMLGDKPYSGVIKDHKGKTTELSCTMLALPGGLDNPLVHRMGILAPHRGPSTVLIDKQGRILSSISAVTGQSGRSGNALINVVNRQDELKVIAMIEKGQAEAAKQFILKLAPHQDPNAVDERGRKIRHPQQSTSHLQARARVYQALGELDKALVDAEAVYLRTFGTSGAMSMRTKELDEAEALRDEIKAQLEK